MGLIFLQIMTVFSNLKGAVCLMGPWDVSQGSESTLKHLGKRKHMLITGCIVLQRFYYCCMIKSKQHSLLSWSV